MGTMDEWQFRSACSTSRRSRRARSAAMPCATRSTSRNMLKRLATSATGSPSTTAHRCSRAPLPEILIAAVAAATSRIKVGSGGVMLPHYSPLKVAEVFSMLAALYPGRIDLGIGRAPGSDRETMFALQRDRRQMSPDDFPEQLAELLAYFEDDFPDGHPLARLAALPGGPERPEVWLLGSSPQSAIWAGELGLPYVFADFINPAGAEIAQLYRDRFVPSRRRETRVRRRRGLGRLRGRRRRGAAARSELAHGDDAAAPGATDPRPAGRDGTRVLRRAPAAERPAGDRRGAGAGACRPRGTGRRVRS